MPRDTYRFPISRRRFNALTGAAGVALGIVPAIAGRALAKASMSADKIIHGKSAEMIVHNAKLGVTETPIALLRKYDHTPKEILFSRYHYPHEGDAAWYATTGQPPADIVKNWTIRVDGLVRRPRTVTIDDLQKRPQEKRVAVLQSPATAAPSTPPSRK